jgi:hypothetical protein
MRTLVPLLLLAVATPLAAEEPDPAKTKTAIEQGVAWLEKRQSADGTFPVTAEGDEKDAVGRTEQRYLGGTTALSLLTLLKCGVKPDDPVIEKGFRWVMAQRPAQVYTVSLEILALEARFQPRPEQVEKENRPYATVARERFQKISRPEDRQFLEDRVAWLLSKQQANVWRYPATPKMGDANQDNSCTQYAVMALKAASRLGVASPPDVWRRVAEYFVIEQDVKGPEVARFPVPAADGEIAAQAQGPTQDRSREASHSMHARGWSYLPRESREEKEHRTYGSMTCSGVAALVIAKSEVEKDKTWWADHGTRIDQGIRDGVAWITSNFSVTRNPGHATYYYYYMYSLERAGVLAGTYQFGKHDWYDEGAARLLKVQAADGSWPVNGKISELSDTCFALLFLERGTIPLVKLPPKRTVTGVGGADAPSPASPPAKPSK